jgi:hypothetical protein
MAGVAWDKESVEYVLGKTLDESIFDAVEDIHAMSGDGGTVERRFGEDEVIVLVDAEGKRLKGRVFWGVEWTEEEPCGS